MNEEFDAYLEAIAMPNALRERVEVLLERARVLCDEDIIALLVTDYFQEGGVRQYDNLFFFSRNFVLETKQFINEDNLDIARFGNNIHYIRIETQSYDLRQATDLSRFHLVANMSSGAGGIALAFDLKASKNNCDYAVRILTTLIRPSLIK